MQGGELPEDLWNGAATSENESPGVLVVLVVLVGVSLAVCVSVRGLVRGVDGGGGDSGGGRWAVYDRV